MFNKLKTELAPENPNVKHFCPTRWTVRTTAINSVIKKNYFCFTARVGDYSSGEPSSKALGLLSVMEKFSTVWIKTSLFWFSYQQNSLL